MRIIFVPSYHPIIFFLLSALLTPPLCSGEEWNPAYFNLGEISKIRASSTCGDQGPELYCNPYTSLDLTMTEHCDVCYIDKQSVSHSIKYAIDGSDGSWQSPSLTRGNQYEQVNVTMDFGRQFEVSYFFMTMGISPRPAVWVLERSTDFGRSYKAWQYFAQNETECTEHFGDVEFEVTKDDSVICDTTFSRVTPFHDGQVIVSLVNGRPTSNVASGRSHALREWMKATNVRLRFLKMYKLEQSVKKYGNHKYFYSIRDISLGGRCVCNGHASTCDPAPPTTTLTISEGNDNNKLICGCDIESHTCGDSCQECCPGYRAVPWRPASDSESFSCQPE